MPKHPAGVTKADPKQKTVNAAEAIKKNQQSVLKRGGKGG